MPRVYVYVCARVRVCRTRQGKGSGGGRGCEGEFRSFAVIIKEIDGGLAQLMSTARTRGKRNRQRVFKRRGRLKNTKYAYTQIYVYMYT